MAQTSAQNITHSYFVVMIDYGHGRGFEAVVDPEVTRNGVIDLIQTREYDPERIAFIHYVDGLEISDVTEELLSEVGAMEAA